MHDSFTMAAAERISVAPRMLQHLLELFFYPQQQQLGLGFQTVHVDPRAVAKEYERRCNAKSWKADTADEALKCWNLERLIDAELLAQPAPEPLFMSDLLREEGHNLSFTAASADAWE
jgi:hypothetical protein